MIFYLTNQEEKQGYNKNMFSLKSIVVKHKTGLLTFSLALKK